MKRLGAPEEEKEDPGIVILRIVFWLIQLFCLVLNVIYQIMFSDRPSNHNISSELVNLMIFGGALQMTVTVIAMIVRQGNVARQNGWRIIGFLLLMGNYFTILLRPAIMN